VGSSAADFDDLVVWDQVVCDELEVDKRQFFVGFDLEAGDGAFFFEG
jgi:hypothetical protein